MTAQEALSKIKELFADQAQATPVEQAAPAATPTEAPKEYSLKDGSKILVDKMEVGGMVAIADASGNSVPAPAGDYVLADDTVISVDQNSTIVAVQVATETPAPAPTDVPQTSMVEQRLTNLQTELNALKEELQAKFQSEINKQSELYQNQFAKQETLLNGLKDVIVGLINLPSEKPITNSNSFNKHVESKQDKINRYLEFVKTIK